MKKTNKQLLSVTMSMVMAAATLTGCGGTSNPTQAETKGSEATTAAADTTEKETEKEESQAEEVMDMGGITIKVANMGTWTPDEVLEADPASDVEVIAYAAELEEKYNCDIKFVGQNFDTIQNSIVTGKPDADIIADMGPANTIGYISSNLYYPISDAGIDLSYPMYDQELINMTTVDGKVYGLRGLPSENEPPVGAAVCFFNKSMMEREGIEDLYALQESGEWTWDKFEEIMTKVTKDTNNDGVMDQVGMVGTNPLVFAHTNGATNLVGSGTDLSFGLNNDATIEAFERTQSWVDKQLVYVPGPEEDWNTPQLKFIAGESAFYIDPLQRMWPINSAGMEDDYGVLFLPKGPQADDYIIYNDWWEGYGVTSTSEHPKEASIILAELCKTDAYTDTDSYIDVTYSDVVRDEESLKIIEQLSSKTVVVQDAAYSDAFAGEDGFNTIVNNIIAGTETPSVGLEKAEPLVNAKLQEIIASRSK